MAGVTTSSFSLLINGAGTTFFNSGRGLRQGCPLSPYLFILVMEGLSQALIEARRTLSFHGISFGTQTILTHLLFVDDVLIFCHCALADCQSLKDILNNFSTTTGMVINDKNMPSIFLLFVKSSTPCSTIIFLSHSKRLMRASCIWVMP
jgi:hypothetical protein